MSAELWPYLSTARVIATARGHNTPEPRSIVWAAAEKGSCCTGQVAEFCSLFCVDKIGFRNCIGNIAVTHHEILIEILASQT